MHSIICGCMILLSWHFVLSGAVALSRYETDYYCDDSLMGNNLRSCQTLSSKVPSANMSSSLPIHIKCRHPNVYLTKEGKLARPVVPDDKISWAVQWNEYKPITFTIEAFKAPADRRPPYADPEISDANFKPKWNTIDGKVDRTSFTGKYAVVDKIPRNPVGRTGICGRGVLGKWGPNHAADPIVTRWKRDTSGNVVTDSKSGMKVLQFVAIERRDTGEWAIPGGMVDAGEERSETLKREFGEEAMNSLQSSKEEKAKLRKDMDHLFTHGTQVYSGYVDDPRNTDNAWMETVAKNFHDESGELMRGFSLTAGDDATGVTWMDVSGEVPLYASHRDLVHRVAGIRGAHW